MPNSILRHHRSDINESPSPASTGAGAGWPAGRIVHLLCRLIIGLTLITTSAGKALDLDGFHDVMRTYDIFPGWSLWPIAIGMPIVEAFIAFSMLSGRRLLRGIQASLLLHASFAMLLTLELARGLNLKNCGCFGVFWARPLTWVSPLEDVVLLGITIGVLLTLPSVRRIAARV